MSICCRAVAFLHGRNGWSRVLGLSCSPVSCRTYGKQSLPVRHSTGPCRGGSELDSVRTLAGAPPPQAGNLLRAVVLSVHFVHLFPVTRTSCFALSTQCLEWEKHLVRVKCHVAGVTDGVIDMSCDAIISIRIVHWGSAPFRCCHRIPSFITVMAASRPVP